MRLGCRVRRVPAQGWHSTAERAAPPSLAEGSPPWRKQRHASSAREFRVPQIQAVSFSPASLALSSEPRRGGCCEIPHGWEPPLLSPAESKSSSHQCVAWVCVRASPTGASSPPSTSASILGRFQSGRLKCWRHSQPLSPRIPDVSTSHLYLGSCVVSFPPSRPSVTPCSWADQYYTG